MKTHIKMVMVSGRAYCWVVKTDEHLKTWTETVYNSRVVTIPYGDDYVDVFTTHIECIRYKHFNEGEAVPQCTPEHCYVT